MIPEKISQLTITRTDTEIEPSAIWRRVHRPEHYTKDAAKFVCSELKLPFFLCKPFVPIARSFFVKWEDAAIETTALYDLPGGERMLRTFFEITDYSNAAVYGMLEKILKKLGVGADLSSKYGDTDFAWVLLGGVLDEFASKAGISKETATALIDFRMPLSDYFTATTWTPGNVEIANLKTGHTASMDIPRHEVNRIIEWSINFENSNSNAKCCRICPSDDLYTEFQGLTELFERKTC